MATNLQEVCLGLIGAAVRTHLEPRCNKLPLWDNGLGALTSGLVQRFVPDITGDVVAQRALEMMGMAPGPRRQLSYRLPEQPKVIDVTGGPV